MRSPHGGALSPGGGEKVDRARPLVSAEETASVVALPRQWAAPSDAGKESSACVAEIPRKSECGLQITEMSVCLVICRFGRAGVRVLLDECLPFDLEPLLVGHEVTPAPTEAGRG